MTINKEIFTRIMACKFAKEAWDKLKVEFQDDEKIKEDESVEFKKTI